MVVGLLSKIVSRLMKIFCELILFSHEGRQNISKSLKYTHKLHKDQTSLLPTFKDLNFHHIHIKTSSNGDCLLSLQVSSSGTFVWFYSLCLFHGFGVWWSTWWKFEFSLGSYYIYKKNWFVLCNGSVHKVFMSPRLTLHKVLTTLICHEKLKSMFQVSRFLLL
jgi:hypothetical protein